MVEKKQQGRNDGSPKINKTLTVNFIKGHQSFFQISDCQTINVQ